MGRRNLYPTLGASANMKTDVKMLMNILSYADGSRDLLSIADKLGVPFFEMIKSVDILAREKLIKVIPKG